jgi:hypothetical protein
MKLHVWFICRLTALVAGALWFIATPHAHAVGIDGYRLQRTFTLPAPGIGSGGNVLMDSLPDGRVLVLNGSTVLVETAPQSETFTSLGDVAGFTPGFGPSFMAVSPDGTRAVAGSNGDGYVAVFDVSNPAVATQYPVPSDLTGDWIDNQRLAITSFGGVQILDTTTSTVRTIINVDGFSAGVTVDAQGNLYTGNGFDGPTGPQTGWIKAFSQAEWQNAFDTNTPITFETSGTLIADLLTASPLGFDASGNMFVGGGDFFGQSNDLGYAALVDASAVDAALAGSQMPPIDASSTPAVLRKFISPPDTVSGELPPFWNFNAGTGELYLGYVFGDGTIYVYAVPEPAALLLATLAGLMLAAGRRR